MTEALIIRSLRRRTRRCALFGTLRDLGLFGRRHWPASQFDRNSEIDTNDFAAVQRSRKVFVTRLQTMQGMLVLFCAPCFCVRLRPKRALPATATCCELTDSKHSSHSQRAGKTRCSVAPALGRYPSLTGDNLLIVDEDSGQEAVVVGACKPADPHMQLQ
jgi:hypothetical protein